MTEPKVYQSDLNGVKGTVISWSFILENSTLEQAQKLSRALPVDGHVALMPDAHLGKGSTIGSVFKTFASIIPAAVGVDIGCGMMAVKTSFTRDQLDEERLKQFYGKLRETVPVGMGGSRNKAHPLWHDFVETTRTPSRVLDDPDLFRRASLQFGTLGDGNHFIELAKDGDDYVWAVLHSGSRGVGNVLASEAISKAQSQCKADGYVLEDPNLAWLIVGTQEAETYLSHMLWAQQYAFKQREAMMFDVLRLLDEVFGEFTHAPAINCHHNYAEKLGNHWLTRKGAIDASEGKLSIIPGSMGEATFIVEGKGNPLAYYSAPHGAGRLYSRGMARRSLDPEEFKQSMTGVLWQDRDIDALIDEAPGAYKNINGVIEAASSLVTVKAELKQFLNYKGTKRPGKKG